MNSSTLSSALAKIGVGSQSHAPGALPTGKLRYPLYRELDGPQGRCGWVRKISPLPGFDHRTVRPVAIRYTDYAIPAHLFTVHEVCLCQKVSGVAGLWPVLQDTEVIWRTNWGAGYGEQLQA